MAVAEMNPSELKSHIDKLSDKIEVLMFNTNQNNFDMNFLSTLVY